MYMFNFTTAFYFVIYKLCILLTNWNYHSHEAAKKKWNEMKMSIYCSDYFDIHTAWTLYITVHGSWQYYYLKGAKIKWSVI